MIFDHAWDDGITVLGKTPGPDEVTQPIGHTEDGSPVYPAQGPVTEETKQPPTQEPPDVQTSDAKPTPGTNYRQYLPEGEYDEAALGPALSTFQAKLTPNVAKVILGFIPQATGFVRQALRDGQGLESIEEKLAAGLWLQVQAAGGTLRDMEVAVTEWERYTKRGPEALFGFTPSPSSPTQAAALIIAKMQALDAQGQKGTKAWDAEQEQLNALYPRRGNYVTD